MVITRESKLNTKGDNDIINITNQVKSYIDDSGINSGIVTVFVTGSTAGITTIEYEVGLVVDFQKVWERLIPTSSPYDHNTSQGNAHAHVRASILGASLTVPFTNKKIALGPWQQIVLVDFDNRPRKHTVIVQVMGE